MNYYMLLYGLLCAMHACAMEKKRHPAIAPLDLTKVASKLTPLGGTPPPPPASVPPGAQSALPHSNQQPPAPPTLSKATLAKSSPLVNSALMGADGYPINNATLSISWEPATLASQLASATSSAGSSVPHSPQRDAPSGAFSTGNNSHGEDTRTGDSTPGSSINSGRSAGSPRVLVWVNHLAIEAIDRGDIEALKNAVQQGADLNNILIEGEFARGEHKLIHRAVCWNKIELLKVLCDLGIDLKAVTRHARPLSALQIVLENMQIPDEEEDLVPLAKELLLRNTLYEPMRIETIMDACSDIVRVGLLDGAASLWHELHHNTILLRKREAREILLFFAARGYAKGVALMHKKYKDHYRDDDIMSALKAAITSAPYFELSEQHKLCIKYFVGWAHERKLEERLDEALCVAIMYGNIAIVELFKKLCSVCTEACELCEKLLCNAELTEGRRAFIERTLTLLTQSPRHGVRSRSGSFDHGLGSLIMSRRGSLSSSEDERSPRARVASVLALLMEQISLT